MGASGDAEGNGGRKSEAAAIEGGLGAAVGGLRKLTIRALGEAVEGLRRLTIRC